VGTNPDVDAWFEAYDNPMRPVLQRVREILLSDPRITESIKWKTPTFQYRGNLASFNPRSKAHASLLFHTGASIPGDHPRLVGGGDVARYMTFDSVEDAERASGDLLRVVESWCASRDG
jgi:hypothetical protein